MSLIMAAIIIRSSIVECRRGCLGFDIRTIATAHSFWRRTSGGVILVAVDDDRGGGDFLRVIRLLIIGIPSRLL